MKTIVILNGPPHCGKDTIGTALAYCFQGITCEFKKALYARTAGFFNVDLAWLTRQAKDRNKKDTVIYPELGSKTVREALIHVSEEHCKPYLGEDFFGKIAALDLERMNTKWVFFTDGGFKEEIQPLLKNNNVIIIQLHGRGDFTNDSRSYIEDENITTHQVYLVEGHPELAVQDIIGLISC